VQAATWHGVADIRFGEVPDPLIEEPLTELLGAYRKFQERERGRLKVALHV
jgi:hypothetical protein